MRRSHAHLALACLVLACHAAPPAARSAAHPAAPPAETIAHPAAADAPAPRFELVESTPLETALDHKDIADAADVWLAMIQGARRSIDFAEFYAVDRPPSRLAPIIAAVEAAIARGVRVRFLAEQSFVAIYPDTLARLARAGAAIRHLDLKHVPGGGGVLHAKYFIVDDRDAFFGSQNLDWRALDHNYELGARVSLPGVVGGLAAIFAADWARAGGEAVPAAAPVAHADAAIRFVASPKELLPAGVAWDLPAIVAAIDGATTSITVEALDYRADGWTELEAPLIRAAGRGVAVELLFADWAKRAKWIAGLQRLAAIPHITVKLTTIPAWSGGFVPYARVSHAKAMVVDGVHGWLGTSNWSQDYFYATRNVGVMIDDPALVGQLVTFFATLWDAPYAMTVDPKATYTPPRIE
ncbi:MAG TPA: phospholipase D-like domain-containing protein [Kofleriaceae bacterium]|nr:phospholipase D-like domain-containing protein [Kofleriaceae bacterium]